MSGYNNIEAFNALVGVLFAEMYEAFPMWVTLDRDDVAEKLFDILDESSGQFAALYPRGADSFEVVPTVHANRFLKNTLHFLCHEGYLMEKGGRDEYKLTTKSLVALGAFPDALKKHETLGGQLIGAVKDGAVQGSKAAVADIVGRFFGGALRSTLGLPSAD